MVYFKEAILACVDIVDTELFLDCKLFDNSSTGMFEERHGDYDVELVWEICTVWAMISALWNNGSVVKMCVYPSAQNLTDF